MIGKWRCRYNERQPHISQKNIKLEMAYFGVQENEEPNRLGGQRMGKLNVLELFVGEFR